MYVAADLLLAGSLAVLAGGCSLDGCGRFGAVQARHGEEARPVDRRLASSTLPPPAAVGPGQIAGMVADCSSAGIAFAFEPTTRTATLRGSVPSNDARDALAQATLAIPGIETVVNELAVEPPGKDPTGALGDGVRGALAADPALSFVEVEERNGRVVLRGTVARPESVLRAILLSLGVEGIDSVSCAIVVAPGPPSGR